jgi:hypothetical protein
VSHIDVSIVKTKETGESEFPDRIDREKALTGFFYAHCRFAACFAVARKVRNPKLNVS